MNLRNLTSLFVTLAVVGVLAATGRTQVPAVTDATTIETTKADASSLIKLWPELTQVAARATIEQYGQPDAATDRLLIWTNKEPWQRIIVYRDAVSHSFPMVHQDFLENTVRYRVPEDKVADLLRFDGGLVIDTTRGELSSHCDAEKSNILALNVAHEVATGKRDVADARRFLRDTMMKSMAGKSSPYMEKLMFPIEAEQVSPITGGQEPKPTVPILPAP